jgi:hypothetical protein
MAKKSEIEKYMQDQASQYADADPQDLADDTFEHFHPGSLWETPVRYHFMALVVMDAYNDDYERRDYEDIGSDREEIFWEMAE